MPNDAPVMPMVDSYEVVGVTQVEWFQGQPDVIVSLGCAHGSPALKEPPVPWERDTSGARGPLDSG